MLPTQLTASRAHRPQRPLLQREACLEASAVGLKHSAALAQVEPALGPNNADKLVGVKGRHQDTSFWLG